MRDHPRRCGENRFDFVVFNAHCGSPPQVRGKLLSRTSRQRRGGITPAGAGKTLRRCRQSRQHRDHPRRCGENPRHHQTRGQSIGSPPQVRGKLSLIENLPTIIRITPAGAGKTALRVVCGNPCWDHPRRCGENADGLSHIESLTGSPPQVRGKPRFVEAEFCKQGITPAGAGKTCRDYTLCCRHRDHPRRCGENGFSRFRKTSRHGITPAGAGKTSTHNF